jgi:probable F420-dependent oxidoreductase
MEFGVVFQADPPSKRIIDLAVAAEAAGFTHAWTFDSHVLWQEPFVIYSQMLSRTERMTVGTMVTNPGTRDWTVTASLFATLREMFGERVVCGIGRGDSALRYIHRSPTAVATMEACIDVIRPLAAGREVEYNGAPLRIPWIEGEWELPIWVGGYGPKVLDLAGRKGDGFILQLADPHILEWTAKIVHDSAKAAGRDPDDITICAAAPAYVSDDLTHAREQCRWFGGMVGNHVADLVTRYGGDGSTVPRELTDYIKGRAGYDYDHHGKADNPTTGFVPDEIVDRFCVLGTVDDHIRKLEELRDLGVDQFGLYLQHDANDETLAAYGAEVVPAFRN